MTGPELIRMYEPGRRIEVVGVSPDSLIRDARGLVYIALELAHRLEVSTNRLIAERNLLCNSVTVVTDVVAPGDLSCSPVFMDPDDEALVAEFDELIEANQKTLARVRGTDKEDAHV